MEMIEGVQGKRRVVSLWHTITVSLISEQAWQQLPLTPTLSCPDGVGCHHTEAILKVYLHFQEFHDLATCKEMCDL